jgi:hypothetical protein
MDFIYFLKNNEILKIRYDIHVFIEKEKIVLDELEYVKFIEFQENNKLDYNLLKIENKDIKAKLKNKYEEYQFTIYYSCEKDDEIINSKYYEIDNIYYEEGDDSLEFKFHCSNIWMCPNKYGEIPHILYTAPMEGSTEENFACIIYLDKKYNIDLINTLEEKVKEWPIYKKYKSFFNKNDKKTLVEILDYAGEFSVNLIGINDENLKYIKKCKKLGKKIMNEKYQEMDENFKIFFS